MLHADVPLIDLGIPRIQSSMVKICQSIRRVGSIFSVLRKTESVGKWIVHGGNLSEAAIHCRVKWYRTVPGRSAILPVRRKVQSVIHSEPSANYRRFIQRVRKPKSRPHVVPVRIAVAHAGTCQDRRSEQVSARPEARRWHVDSRIAREAREFVSIESFRVRCAE